jgi:hypothetical protein
MRYKVLSILTSFVVVLGLLVLTGSAALAHGSHGTAFSGYEVYPGYPEHGIIEGTTFGGWAHGGTGWLSPGDGSQSYWGATINYSGKAGLNSAVTITGGKWAWHAPDGTIHAGQVLDGRVEWPATLGVDIGCGAGIAKFSAHLAPEGTLSGCLDDTHIPQVFPPRIWGAVVLR